MPTPTAITSAAKASSRVAGMRCRITVSAGSPKMKERPRSPCRAPRTKWRYCSQIGRSRPSARTAASMSRWSICGLTSSQTGSPITCTPKNTITDMTTTTTAVCIRRRRR